MSTCGAGRWQCRLHISATKPGADGADEPCSPRKVHEKIGPRSQKQTPRLPLHLELLFIPLFTV